MPRPIEPYVWTSGEVYTGPQTPAPPTPSSPQPSAGRGARGSFAARLRLKRRWGDAWLELAPSERDRLVAEALREGQ